MVDGHEDVGLLQLLLTQATLNAARLPASAAMSSVPSFTTTHHGTASGRSRLCCAGRRAGAQRSRTLQGRRLAFHAPCFYTIVRVLDRCARMTCSHWLDSLCRLPISPPLIDLSFHTECDRSSEVAAIRVAAVSTLHLAAPSLVLTRAFYHATLSPAWQLVWYSAATAHTQRPHHTGGVVATKDGTTDRLWAV